jgi:peptide chain release factor 1
MIPLEKVQDVVVKYDSLEKELSTGTIDSKTFAQKSKEYSDLGNIISYARSYIKFDDERKELEQILQDKSSDSEMRILAEKELDILKQKKIDHTNKLKIFLLPKDDDDSKNAIVEIRAGTGGLEASLFCSDLFKMYEKVCTKKKMETRDYKYF